MEYHKHALRKITKLNTLVVSEVITVRTYQEACRRLIRATSNWQYQMMLENAALLPIHWDVADTLAEYVA